MTARRSGSIRARGREAVLWIDHHRAVVVGHGPGGHEHVALVDREIDESEWAFGARTVGEVIDLERVLVCGPVDARTGFERAYVAVTHRPERLVDVEPAKPNRPDGAATRPTR